MNAREQALSIPCQGEPLAGVLSLPEQVGELGVVIVVGGPQYRAGSHRQFVLLARHLAACGIATLRFDVRGMGDSGGPQRSFEDLDADLRAAIDALCQAVPAVRQVALWGLCDGASAALLYLDRQGDARVGALCLVNPWVRSVEGLARTHLKHHYRRRLLDPGFWRRVFTGKVGLRAVSGLWSNLLLTLGAGRKAAADEALGFRQRMARAWSRFPGRILLLLSEHDYTADEFRVALSDDPAWKGAQARAGVECHTLAGADHTLSSRAARESAERLTSGWLLRRGG